MRDHNPKTDAWLVLTTILLLAMSPYWLNMAGIHLDFYDLRRFLQLCFVSALSLLAIASPMIYQTARQIEYSLPAWVKYAVLLFFIIGVISSFIAPLPQFALLQVANYALIMFSVIVVAALTHLWGPTKWRWLLLSIGLGWALLCFSHFLVMGLWLHAVSHFIDMSPNLQIDPNLIRHMTVFPNFSNPRFIAQAISWCWPVLVLPLMLTNTNRSNYLAWAVPFFILASLVWCLAFANQSRALFLEWAIIPVLMIALGRSLGWRWLKWQALTAALGFILFWFVHFYLIPHVLGNGAIWATLSSLEQHAESHFRLSLYQLAISMTMHNPFLGIGPMHFAYYGLQSPIDQATMPSHPHNAWLLISAEWGLIAVALLLAIFFKGVHTLIRNIIATNKLQDRDNDHYCINLAVTASFAGAMLHALVSGIIVMPLSQVFFIIIVGWLIGLNTNLATSIKITKRSRIIASAIIIVTLMVLLYGIYPMLGNWQEAVLAYIQQTDSHMIAPNFWAEGWIQFWK